MNRSLTWTLLLSLAAAPRICGAAAEVQQQKGTKWVSVSAALVTDFANLRNAPAANLDKYGGLADQTVKATGFFRTEKIDSRWWFIDPDGHPFISAGICSANLTQSARHTVPAGYADEQAWADATSKLLRDNGFNTLGCWSDWKSFQGDSRMPYTAQSDFVSAFAKKLGISHEEVGHTGFPNDCMPIFNPDFESFCDDHARELAATADDPWLLGHFSDNELPLFPTSLHNFLSLPDDDPGHQAAQHWLDARYHTPAGQNHRIYTPGDQDAFLQFAATRYYTVVAAAIHKYDPNHLYLGSRLYGKSIAPSIFKASTAVDVVSVNYYKAWSADQTQMSLWSRLSGRPILISEWYAMKLDSPAKQVEGAGFRVSSEAGRGMFYQNYAISLLRNPSCVGWHWFKYGGDSPGREIGVVDSDYQPHSELLQLMQQLNARIYPLANYFLPKR